MRVCVCTYSVRVSVFISICLTGCEVLMRASEAARVQQGFVVVTSLKRGVGDPN